MYTEGTGKSWPCWQPAGVRQALPAPPPAANMMRGMIELTTPHLVYGPPPRGIPSRWDDAPHALHTLIQHTNGLFLLSHQKVRWYTEDRTALRIIPSSLLQIPPLPPPGMYDGRWVGGATPLVPSTRLGSVINYRWPSLRKLASCTLIAWGWFSQGRSQFILLL